MAAHDNQLGEEMGTQKTETDVQPTQPYTEEQVAHEEPQAKQVANDEPQQEGGSDSQPATPSLAPSQSTSVREKPVEGMTWSDLQVNRKEWCSRCQEPVEGSPTKRVQKKGHAQVSCRRCHNVVTLLYRNLEMAKLPEFSQMDPDQAKQFFQKAKETMVGGQFSFGRIKGLLTNTLTEIERQVSSTSVKGKYHPLEVWASKGYNAKSIEEKCEWKNSALFLGGCLWHCGEFDVVLFLLFLKFICFSSICYSQFLLLQVWQGLQSTCSFGGLRIPQGDCEQQDHGS